MGTIDNPSVVVTYSGLPCGDNITLYLKISEDGVIRDAKFQYKGCIGTASALALTMLIIGKAIEGRVG